MEFYTALLIGAAIGICLGVWLAFLLIKLGELIRNRNEVKVMGKFYDNVR